MKKPAQQKIGYGIAPERIREIIRLYVPQVPDHLEFEIQKYVDLLGRWSNRIPLTSIRDPEEIVRFHFGESIFAISMIGRDSNGRLADVGTGAGFPGLPLKLADQTIDLLLIEPNRKKCVFLHEALRLLAVGGAAVLPTRFESTDIENGSLHFIISRALGRNAAVLKWAKWKLALGGSVLLWIGREDATGISETTGWRWEQPVLIPGTRERYIIKGVRES